MSVRTSGCDGQRGRSAHDGWSKRLGGWTDLIFTAANSDEDHEPCLSVLQDAEAVFLEAIDSRKGSPYYFGFNA